MSQLASHAATVTWVDLTAGTTRAHGTDGRTSAADGSITVYLEKVPGRGEDAPPVHLVADDGTHVLAVCDGLGGAGSTQRRVGSEEYSEAYLAARLASTVVRRAGAHGRTFDGPSLTSWLEESFATFDRRNPAQRASRIQSRMVRTLPTTFAAALARPVGPHHRVSAVWAGDSRVYVLRPGVGLQQISSDHVRDPDPLHQLVNDGPLETIVSRSRPFELEVVDVDVDGPLLVVVATDGVFGYVRTPGEVEHHLLDTLVSSGDTAEWSSRLATRISGYTGDDATLAVAAVGFSGFGDLVARLARRADQVRSSQWAVMEAVGAADDAARARERSWADYAPAYLALQPRRDVG